MLKLSVSNIGWDNKETESLLPFFHQQGLTGIEIAPSKIWGDWDNITLEKAKSYRNFLAQAGFVIPAFQAILFGRPDARLLQGKASEEAFYQHIVKVADIAHAMDCPVLVWGAPASRKKGELSTAQANDNVADILRKTGDACHDRGVTLCLEANPPEYGCDFIVTNHEALELIKMVDSPGFGLHLDIAAATMVGEDIGDLIRLNDKSIRHFHASEVNLEPIPSRDANKANASPHDMAKYHLEKIHYGKWVSLEMRQPASISLDEAVIILKQSIKNFSQYYQGDHYDGVAKFRKI
jgi:sugar phosphate isomerase/epimerase